MSERPRPDDHLVEPLFAALREVDPAQASRPRRRLGLALLVLLVIAAIWFVTVGA